jgi:hypothetical protein
VKTQWTALLGALSFGCGEPEPAILDDLATERPPPEASQSWDLTEQIIQPGDDVQICHFLEETTEEMWVKSFNSFQGKYGHHLIIFKARITEKPGTIRDCTSAEDMIRLSPIISSVQFGLERFPDGMAIRVPRGSQIVLQQHYVNTSEKPIRVKDVAYVETVPASDVMVPAGFFGISDIDFELAPNATDVQRVAFECEVPRDMKLLLAGPHMHEWGTQFVAEMGPASGPTEVLRVDKWEAWMRDEPPVHDWGKDAPFELKEGDVMRTACTFKNTTSRKLIFPTEMCATYGYYFPAPNGSEEFTCAGRRID